jgi:hypothetical protein
MHVTSTSPSDLLTGQSKEITLTGIGFKAPVTCIIYGIFLPAFFVISTLVKFVLPYVPEGTYDIVVVNGDGATWIQRQALRITDAPGTFSKTLGSVDFPLVLPPIVIDTVCSATISPASDYRTLDSGAVVYYDPASGEVTATKQIDSSVVATEHVARDYDVESPTAGQILTTPWGTFTN